jgi:Holliday junction resolvase
MSKQSSVRNPHDDVLDRIKRGLSGYVSYLAACEMKSAFSEYVLYEPILRVLTARGYEAKCEVECPGFDSARAGDKKRIDFVARNRDALTFAMEVKWAKKGRLDVEGDIEKLLKYKASYPGASCFLCVFGRKSHISEMKLRVIGLTEFREPVFAEFRKTKYGCRMYVLRWISL